MSFSSMSRRSFLGAFASRSLPSVNSKHLNLKPHLLITSSCTLPHRSIALCQTRNNFSYAGPRKLDDILKVHQIKDKTKAEVSDLWMTYHEGKEKVHGLVLSGDTGKSILARAAQCPFFIHPVFREGGHFMILSQFQPPSYFLLALLEDYKMDPARAQPILTLSVFDDLLEKDLTLVRCDIINNGIEDDEGYKLAKCVITDYSEDDAFTNVHLFNKMPDKFDIDAFVGEREKSWNADD